MTVWLLVIIIPWVGPIQRNQGTVILQISAVGGDLGTWLSMSSSGICGLPIWQIMIMTLSTKQLNFWSQTWRVYVRITERIILPSTRIRAGRFCNYEPRGREWVHWEVSTSVSLILLRETDVRLCLSERDLSGRFGKMYRWKTRRSLWSSARPAETWCSSYAEADQWGGGGFLLG